MNNELWRAIFISFLSSPPFSLRSTHRVHNKCVWSYFGPLLSLDSPQPGATMVPTEEMREGYQQLSQERQASYHQRTTKAPPQVSNYPLPRREKRKDLTFIIPILQIRKLAEKVK